MFCYQCEQTKRGTGCLDFGQCGKDEATAVLQDLLLYGSQGISMYACRAAAFGATDRDIDLFVLEALFTTVTNVNFDSERLVALLSQCAAMLHRAQDLYEQACRAAGKTPDILSGPAAWKPAPDLAGLLEQGRDVSIPSRQARLGADVAGLEELCLYGLKGAAAYIDHAVKLGFEDSALYADIHNELDFLARPRLATDDMLARCLKIGEINYRAMELLDRANTTSYGHPTPTSVRIEPVKGKAILVSGHDLKDLEALLVQTTGTGINVYTHGEMLPAHGYPRLHAYPHLVGNYGGAWMNQVAEFDAFPGAVLMTTNCIQRPRESYENRIFTCGLVAFPGVQHIAAQDFGPVIQSALEAPGFTQDGADKTIMVGFGHTAVLNAAPQIIEAVKSGALRRFFLIGGCDGARPGRDYYTQLATAVPDDCVILTLACGKYRFNKLDFGTLGGLPRLLDIGQCNDAYSAIKIATALAGAFDCGVNDLPLSLVLSWYEQKAVAILLTLLYLGIRNIRIGPSLPAFITPAVLNVLVDKFGIMLIGEVDTDLRAMLAA